MIETRDWENPLVTGHNQRCGHVPLARCADHESALRGDYQASAYLRVLSGRRKLT